MSINFRDLYYDYDPASPGADAARSDVEASRARVEAAIMVCRDANKANHTDREAAHSEALEALHDLQWAQERRCRVWYSDKVSRHLSDMRWALNRAVNSHFIDTGQPLSKTAETTARALHTALGEILARVADLHVDAEASNKALSDARDNLEVLSAELDALATARADLERARKKAKDASEAALAKATITRDRDARHAALTFAREVADRLRDAAGNARDSVLVAALEAALEAVPKAGLP
jgi:hypothetical protein